MVLAVLVVIMVFSVNVQSDDYLSEIEAETIKLHSGLQMSPANQADKQNGNQSGSELQ